MLTIKIPSKELWDEEKEEFITMYKKELAFEHSLFSIHKWESKWKRSFMESKEFTYEENRDYIRCMCLSDSIEDSDVNWILSNEQKTFSDYISDNKTATYMRKPNSSPVAARDKLTAELIYYWMVSFQIPFECQYWHLSQLMALIEVCNAKNGSPNKSSRNSMLSQNAKLNAARRKSMNSRG